MPDTSAVIIPFPARARPARAAPPARTGAERLARSLAALDAALAAQREAVAAWRVRMAELGGAVQALSGSLTAYQARLGMVDGGVRRLAAEATKLERWAEKQAG